MSTFPEALAAALRRRLVPAAVTIRTPITQRRGLVAYMGRLVKAHGGDYKRAAAAAGIPARTWRDWRNGTHPPSPRSLRKLLDAYDRQVIRPAVIGRLVKHPITRIDVFATVVADPKGSRYTNRKPERTFRAEKINTGAVVSAWLTGSAAYAATTFEAAVKDAYGTPFGFEGDNVRVTLHPKL